MFVQKMKKSLVQLGFNPLLTKGHFQKPQKNRLSITSMYISLPSKVVIIWDLALTQIFNLFPANIWILKWFFLVIFAIKMSLDNTYGLLNILEFLCNNFNSLFLVESEFLNSNVGGKQI